MVPISVERRAHLFESIEGKRGEPRNKPPYPTTSGLFGKPTAINNVETLVHTVMIMKYGAAHFRELGTKDSRGSKVFSVSGDTPKAGIFELELGMSVNEFVKSLVMEIPKRFRWEVLPVSVFPGRDLKKPSLVSKVFLPVDP